MERIKFDYMLNVNQRFFFITDTLRSKFPHIFIKYSSLDSIIPGTMAISEYQLSYPYRVSIFTSNGVKAIRLEDFENLLTMDEIQILNYIAYI